MGVKKLGVLYFCPPLYIVHLPEVFQRGAQNDGTSCNSKAHATKKMCSKNKFTTGYST